MQRKTIFFTVTNDLVYDQRMKRICSTLSQAGYSVRLIGRQKKSSVPLADENYGQLRLHCFFEKGKLFYIEFNIRLFWFLLFSKFDAVCCIDLDTLAPGFLVAKMKGEICVYDAHEYFTEVPEVIERPFVKSVWEALGKLIIPRLKYCYTVCESLSDIFFEKYKTKFSVIRNLPFKSCRDDLPKALKQPAVILYQGALNAGRGLEQAIDAMEMISGAVLWLAGEGDLSDDLRNRVEQKKLQHKVVFKGFLKPAELWEVTLKATIGLNLLEGKSQNYYYSLANKAFDYIQAGVPAIHMDFPEYRKLNQRYEVACLIDRLDPALIAVAINKLLENKALYEKLATNCSIAANELTWEKESQKLLDFYKKLFKTESGQ